MSSKGITILGIESSCDETSAAVFKDGKILANLIAGQAVHKQYGGVVPELASSTHQVNIVPVVKSALDNAKVPIEEINAIAYTRGPGLMGSLLVGSSFAKSLAQALSIPLLEVNHMQAHVLSNFIENTPPFPFLCLTVSGGHTQIVLVKDYLEMEIIGETTDDAAGEAFDKAAKILGLPYPGGPLIDKHAKSGDPQKFNFPIPKVPGYNYSFSGLKTSFLYFLREKSSGNPNFIQDNLGDICASYQHAIISTLMEKLDLAARDTGINHVAIAGGVSANSSLRETILSRNASHGWSVYIPKFEYCTDNAAMIAMAGYFKYLKKDFSSQAKAAKARLEF